MDIKLILPLALFILQLLTTPSEGSSCQQAETCDTCLTSDKRCAWCEDADFGTLKNGQPRCDFEEQLSDRNCKNIVNPNNEFNYIKNEDLRDGDGGSDGIQIQPQEINIKLRPKKPYKFKLSYRQAKNYPVDLYVLMDLSGSMEKSKDRLANLGKSLAVKMKHVTENFMLGFGSFVEKEIPPFVFSDANLPMCEGCVPSYAYRHALELSSNGTQFSEIVANAKMSGNNDLPEAGFDALMQSLVCKQIGWRSKSRKLVLFIAGSSFHHAGDGKILGIVKPNDEKCHLDFEGLYTESRYQDYPSIHQIRKQVNEMKAHVIFAINRNQKATYESLSKFLLGSAVTILTKDFSNIIEVIQSNYDRITQKVELTTEHSDNITVKFSSKCYGDQMKPSNVCENVRTDSKVEFDVEIQVDECPEKVSDRKRTLVIHPIGLSNKLTVHLELLCECQCNSKVETKSSECNDNGNKVCGACVCNQNYIGRTCECNRNYNVTNPALDKQCQTPNNSLLCSGQGQCICGVCQCDIIQLERKHTFSGRYCECDDYSCDIIDGKLCGGEEQGYCDCGKCKCTDGFKGENCECPQSKATCVASNGLVCNEKGSCECGVCICDPKKHYHGPFCETSPFYAGMCSESKQCVLCKVFETGSYSKEKCAALCPYDITIVSELRESRTLMKCQFVDDDSCTILYQYWYDGTKVMIEAKENKSCPISDHILPIVVFVCIILIGIIAILIYKLVILFQDRKERSTSQSNLDDDPLASDPDSTFMNPIYVAKN